MADNRADWGEYTGADAANLTGLGKAHTESLILEIIAQLDEEAVKVAQKSSLMRGFLNSLDWSGDK